MQQSVESGSNPAVLQDVPPIVNEFPADLVIDNSPTASAMFQNNLATTKAQCIDGNNKRKSDYLNFTWGNYVLNMQSGQHISDERQIPPKPPKALIVSPPNAEGRVAPIEGPDPVCAMPPVPTYLGGLLPIVPIPNHPHIGAQIPDGHGGMTAWFQAGDDDGVPSGTTIPNPDSPMDGHMYEKFGSPFRNFGKGGLYLQVK